MTSSSRRRCGTAAPSGPASPHDGAGDDAAELGDDVDGIAHAVLAIHVTGGDGTFAQMWRDGAMLEPELAVTGDDFTASFDDAPGAGDFRYRVELVSNGNQRIVVRVSS